jgi:hypothetical protein
MARRPGPWKEYLKTKKPHQGYVFGDFSYGSPVVAAAIRRVEEKKEKK